LRIGAETDYDILRLLFWETWPPSRRFTKKKSPRTPSHIDKRRVGAKQRCIERMRNAHAGKAEAFDCGVPPHLFLAASNYISAMEEAQGAGSPGSAKARAARFQLVRRFAS
jgi:hypothetical protein